METVLQLVKLKGYKQDNIILNVQTLTSSEISAWQQKIKINEKKYEEEQQRMYLKHTCSSFNFDSETKSFYLI